MENYYRKNILVVEDEDINYFFICLMLINNQANVLRACNGLEAVNIIKAKPNIDLVLMDIQLPIMSGWDAILEIKQINSNLPIIVQTAYAKQKKRSDELGCSGFIAKPYNYNDLFLLIQNYL